MNKIFNDFEIDFIEIKKDKKYVWEWRIELKLKNNVKYNRNIKINDVYKHYFTIKPDDELLMESLIYNSDTRKGYTYCDIIFKNIDVKEICFYKICNNIVNFIINNFYKKFNNSLNKKILTFINPIGNNIIKTYLAKNSKYIFTKFVNIDTLENENIIMDIPLNTYIYPELKFNSIKIIDKCIYIDIILTDSFIYKINKCKQIKTNKINEKGIMRIPNEIFLNIIETYLDDENDLENLILTCKKFFLLFISNYKFLHEKWILSSRINRIEWKYQKIKSILNF